MRTMLLLGILAVGAAILAVGQQNRAFAFGGFGHLGDIGHGGTSSPGSGSLFLEDGSSFLLLEDGSSKLCLESGC